MIDLIFTVDYEIYGNGTGDLQELVYEPTRLLKALFEKHGVGFVNFVEVAEFEKISARGTDRAIEKVEKQIRDCHRDGFEVGLHLHPQWANAIYENRRWKLDLEEYNLCHLPKARINEIVDDALVYLRNVIGESNFTPISFRAGNWLFQPTQAAAEVLSAKGLRIDSSVFKGGRQHNNGLDYRAAAKNGYYWPFNQDVSTPDWEGSWIEVPIHTRMVPIWKMRTSKRMKFSNQFGVSSESTTQKIGRALDFLRFLYPLKLDFCRMTFAELSSMMEEVIRKDQRDRDSYRPIVAIGHSKDLVDFNTIDLFLSWLKAKNIPVRTFGDIYPKLRELAWPVPDHANRETVAV